MPHRVGEEKPNRPEMQVRFPAGPPSVVLKIAFLLLLFLTGCKGGGEPTLASAAPPPTSPPPTATRPQIPSRTPTATTTPTFTPTPTPSVTPSPTELPTIRHLRIFDQLDQLVRDNYLYLNFGGLNWPAWAAIHREQVAAGMTDDQFYRAMSELVGKLGDGHSTFQSPAAADETNAAIQGQRQMVGIGVEMAARPERNTAVLLAVYPQGPAWLAGLRPHDSVLSVDGQPILQAWNQLEGPAGSAVTLTVQTPGQHPRQVQLVRALVDSPPPVAARQLTEDGIVYAQIRTLWDRNTTPLLRQRLEELGSQQPITGVILDLRINRGGSEHTLAGLLSLFANGTLGHFVRRSGERPLVVTGAGVHNSQTVPLLVLIGRETMSYAEVLAGVLQSTGRAQLVGTVTSGNVETIWPHDFEDGSRLWLAEEGFRALNGGDWEQKGVTPDYFIPLDWADFADETDTQLATAVQLLGGAP